MNISILKQSEILSKIGNIFFRLGILLLPAGFFYASIFLFISFIVANIYETNFLRDKWNYPLLICTLLMIFICMISNLITYDAYNSLIEKNLNWLGLLNWIPLFWAYWCSQFYLKDIKDRKSCALFLVLGTIPVLISGFGQYFFGWYGPIKLLNGTIIWYQREVTNQNLQTLTGLFNNANYAGTWLAVIFPFCFFFLIQSKRKKFKKVFYLIFSIAIAFAAVLTNSRNSIINIIISFALIIGLSFKTLFLVFLVIAFSFGSIFIFEIPLDFLSFFRDNKFLNGFIPGSNNFSDITSFPRVRIWETAISNIIKRPLLGWGASSFSLIYLIKNGEPTYQHTHNLFLEMANNYGIINSLILFTTISLLMYKTKPIFYSKKIFCNFNDQLINKFWWISTLIILLMQLTDITYYDGRVSILFWILIAGIRCQLKEKTHKKLSLN
ncbi:O-antigen ligase family protein [Prochlorococcus sp. AH-736-N03]|nr:O-antigen ligase family protein [Prochlorococcus sp. AH-736-N03]